MNKTNITFKKDGCTLVQDIYNVNVINEKEANEIFNKDIDEKFIDTIIKKLIHENIKITTMESCTSGMVANLITNTEGASKIFKGAEVTYSNEAKIIAGVDGSVIEKYGVYSIETAAEMAKKCKEKFKADIGIGVTGTTGNVDQNNNDSIKGVIFYEINYKEKYAKCTLNIDTTNLSRKEIKERICNNIFVTLSLLI